MQIPSKSSISQSLIYLLLLGFTFIELPKTGVTYLFSRVVQVVEMLIFTALFIQFVKQKTQLCKFNWLTNIWWLFYTYIAYSFTTNVMGLTPLFNWLNVIILLLLGVCYWQDDMESSIKYIATTLSLLIYLNAVLLVLYPDGLWIDENWAGGGDPRRYLFGNYNQMGFVSLLGCTAQAMYTFATTRGRWNLLFLMLVSIGTVIFVGSMTSTIGLCILGLYILLNKMIKRPKIYFTLFMIVYIAFFVVIVWGGTSVEEIKIMTNFIENVLSKDVTFTHRTDIWSNTINYIQRHPWMGNGIQSIEWNMAHIDGSGAHNLWLTLLLQGGILLTATFIYIIFAVIRRALSEPTKAGIVGIVAICVYCLMSLFEAYSMIQTFLLLQLVYYSPLLKNKSEIIDTTD